MIRDVGESVGEAVFGTVGRVVGRTQEQRPLPADLLEDDDAYLVVFDAPGVDPADVQVRFEDGAVHVRLDRFRDYEEGFEMRFPGRGLSLEGKKRLPPNALVDPTDATATMRDDGTLEVHVPKTAGSTVDVEPAPADEDSED